MFSFITLPLHDNFLSRLQRRIISCKKCCQIEGGSFTCPDVLALSAFCKREAQEGQLCMTIRSGTTTSLSFYDFATRSHLFALPIKTVTRTRTSPNTAITNEGPTEITENVMCQLSSQQSYLLVEKLFGVLIVLRQLVSENSDQLQSGEGDKCCFSLRVRVSVTRKA